MASVTEQLKSEKARGVELKETIRQLTEEIKVLKGEAQEINIEDLTSSAINVRFDSEEGLYMLDTVLYSSNGIATLVSSEPVAPKGQGDKVEFALQRLQKYLFIEVKNRLIAEEAERRNNVSK